MIIVYILCIPFYLVCGALLYRFVNWLNWESYNIEPEDELGLRFTIFLVIWPLILPILFVRFLLFLGKP